MFERFDEEIIQGHPDGASPIGIAAEKAGGRFAGLVIEGELLAAEFEFHGMGLVEFRDGA